MPIVVLHGVNANHNGHSMLGRDLMPVYTLKWKELFTAKMEMDEAIELEKLPEEITAEFLKRFHATHNPGSLFSQFQWTLSCRP